MALAGRPNSQIVFLVFAKFSRNYLTTCSRNFHCFIMGILNDLLKFHFSLIQYLFNTYFFVKQMTSKTTRVSYNSQIPSFLVLTKFYRNYETTCSRNFHCLGILNYFNYRLFSTHQTVLSYFFTKQPSSKVTRIGNLIGAEEIYQHA